MLQLSGLDGDVPPDDPAKPVTPIPITQQITVTAISTWHALGVGVVTGFAIALGTLVFERFSKTTGLKR